MSVQNTIVSVDEAAVEVLGSRGYRPVRHFYRMAIELGDEAPEPAWPEGIRVERFREEDALAFHEAIEDAWQDHWDHSPRPFEQFRERLLEGSRYDPTLWTVAWAGDEIAGGTICEAELLRDGLGALARRCAGPGGGWARAWRCSSTRSASSTSAASDRSDWASTPRARPGRRACTSGPACTSSRTRPSIARSLA